MRRKLLAIIAMAAMLVTMVPTLAFADIADTDVAAIGETGYDSLKDAFEAAKSGDTITLLKDVTLDENDTYHQPAEENGRGKHHHHAACVVSGDKSITFNMNGHSMNLNYDVNGLLCKCALLKDPSEYHNHGGSGAIIVQDGANLTITGNGNVSAAGTTAVIWAQGKNSKITIENGTFKNNDDIADVVYADAGGEIYIQNGTFGSPLLVDKRLPGKSDTINCDGDLSKIEITGGGTFSEDPTKCTVVNAADGESECNTVADGYIVKKDGSNYTVLEAKSLTDGVYTTNPTAYIASGYEVSEDKENGLWTVSEIKSEPEIVPSGSEDSAASENQATATDNNADSQVQTGDNFNPLIFGGIALLALAAMAAVVATRRKHN